MTEQKTRVFAISEICGRWGIQICHKCDNLRCDDNTSDLRTDLIGVNTDLLEIMELSQKGTLIFEKIEQLSERLRKILEMNHEK